MAHATAPVASKAQKVLVKKQARKVRPGRKTKRRAKPKDVTSLSFGKRDYLNVGYSDGYIAPQINIRRRRTWLRRAVSKKRPIIKISPNAQLVISTFPAHKVVRTKDRRIMLELNNMKTIATANFSPDGDRLIVTEKGGQIHVWRKALNLTDLLGKHKRLETYLNRQEANFKANFGVTAAPVYIHGNEVVFGDSKGQLFYWDIRTPSKGRIIWGLPTQADSVGMQGDTLLATTGGKLLAASIKKRRKLAWSKGNTAQMIVTHPNHKNHFAAIDNGVLSLRFLKNGKNIWRANIGTGKVCGLALDSKQKYVASCVNNTITIHHLKTGKKYRKMQRQKNVMKWRIK